MKEDLISLIIPVYNVEKYIRECIDSVICQSYKNIEIIIVDDGSRDNSGKICDKYAENDRRIQVIHKKNEGVSKARNVGIEMAKGKYISFVDADDIINKEYVKTLYNLCKGENADISICGTEDFDCSGKIFSKSLRYKNNLNSEEGLKELLNEKYYTCVVWAKMYKRELFNDIAFNESTKIAEDLEIIYKLIAKSKKISIDTSKIMYYYRDRDDSATAAEYNKDWEKEIKICEEILNFIKKEYPQLVNYAIKRYVRINVTCICKILKYSENIDGALKLRENILKYGRNAYFKANYIIRLKIFMIRNNIYILDKIYKKKYG